jgi:hypothetical protein
MIKAIHAVKEISIPATMTTRTILGLFDADYGAKVKHRKQDLGYRDCYIALEEGVELDPLDHDFAVSLIRNQYCGYLPLLEKVAAYRWMVVKTAEIQWEVLEREVPVSRKIVEEREITYLSPKTFIVPKGEVVSRQQLVKDRRTALDYRSEGPKHSRMPKAEVERLFNERWISCYTPDAVDEFLKVFDRHPEKKSCKILKIGPATFVILDSNTAWKPIC